MYITLLGKLLEIVLDIGDKGFNMALYIAQVMVFSVEAYYRDIAVFVIAIATIYALKRRKR